MTEFGAQGRLLSHMTYRAVSARVAQLPPHQALLQQRNLLQAQSCCGTGILWGERTLKYSGCITFEDDKSNIR